MRIVPWRRESWFGVTALLLAYWMAVLGSVPLDASGGTIPSHGSKSTGSQEEDVNRLQRFLETKIVQEQLKEYGVSPDVVRIKLREMSDGDLHVLASAVGRIPEGGSDGENAFESVNFIWAAFFLTLVVLIILGILFAIGVASVKHFTKKKSQRQEPAPPPEPAVEPAK